MIHRKPSLIFALAGAISHVAFPITEATTKYPRDTITHGIEGMYCTNNNCCMKTPFASMQDEGIPAHYDLPFEKECIPQDNVPYRPLGVLLASLRYLFAFMNAVKLALLFLLFSAIAFATSGPIRHRVPTATDSSNKIGTPDSEKLSKVQVDKMHVNRRRRGAQQRSSTVGWLKAFIGGTFVRERNLNELSMLTTMMLNIDSEDKSANHDSMLEVTPVNVLVLDGGGMRGYAGISMMREMSEMMDCDFLECFDLIGGVSVGGVGSLFAGCSENTDDWLDTLTSVLDEVRTGTFSKWSFRRLFSEGVLMKCDRRDEVYRRNIGTYTSCDELSREAFALAAKWNDEKSSAEPFVMRTYDLSGYKNGPISALPGTNEMPISQAMTATSAAPVAFRRTSFVKIDKSGNCKYRLCDGGIVSNSPVSIALREAKTLWPHRPIGVVLSLGLVYEPNEDAANKAAIDIINSFQMKSGGGTQVCYTRLVPPVVLWMDPSEVNQTKIDHVMAETRSYIKGSTTAKNVCDELSKSKIHQDAVQGFQSETTEQSPIIPEAEHTKKHSSLHVPSIVRPARTQIVNLCHFVEGKTHRASAKSGKSFHFHLGPAKKKTRKSKHKLREL